MSGTYRNCLIAGALFVFVVGLYALAVFHKTWAAPQVTRKNVDAELLDHVVRAEAEAEPYTGKVAVAAVILNRIQSPKFPNTLAGVIYQPKAFESVANGTVNQAPTPDCRKAAQDAIAGWDPSGGALFFFNPAKVGAGSYVWTRQIIQKIGKHVFAL
jgi:N-acetylmuramoyl-L-alanine amidase